MSVDLTEATLGQDGQLIITGEDGQGITNSNLFFKSPKNLNVVQMSTEYSYSGFPVNVSGMITVPVSAQMYQTMVANMLPNGDGTVCITPMQVPNHQGSSLNLNTRTTVSSQNVTISTNSTSSTSNVSNVTNSLFPLTNTSFNLNSLKRPRNVPNMAATNANMAANFASLFNQQALAQQSANQSKKPNVISTNNNSSLNNNNPLKITIAKDLFEAGDKSIPKPTPALPPGVVILNAKDLLNESLPALLEKQVQLVRAELEAAQQRPRSVTTVLDSLPSSPASSPPLLDTKDITITRI